MSVCPNCNYEYVDGVTICPDCGTALVDESVIQKPRELSEEDWEVIYTTNDEYEVDMIRDNLKSAGIEATILSQKDRNFPAPGDFSLIKLLVRKNDVKDALNYIQATKNQSDSEDK
ncbi:MAG: zinc-ribbon domain-containing protein [Ignavibacteriaceae bacterium]|jgi:uncharacterized Zn finger protein (UPF0148 family)